MKLNRIIGLTPSKVCDPVSTGFHELNILTGGFPVGQISILGGRPGMGTTTVLISMMRNIGLRDRVPMAYLSMEHNEFEVVKRLTASMVGFRIDNPIVRKALSLSLDVEDPIIEDWLMPFPRVEDRVIPSVKDRVTFAKEGMKEAPVWIEHHVGMTIDEIVSMMERLRQENNIRLLFIDSLQWIRMPESYAGQSQALMQLREAAERLQVAVVLTTTLNCTVEFRGAYKRPRLADLPENMLKNIETYASLVMLLYRPGYYHISCFEDNTPTQDLAEIMVEKNNNGNRGKIRVRYGLSMAYYEMIEGDEKNEVS